MHHAALRCRVWDSSRACRWAYSPVVHNALLSYPLTPHAGQPGHIPFRDSRSLLVCSAIYVLATVHLTAGVLGLGRLVICGVVSLLVPSGWMCSGGIGMFGEVPHLSLLVVHVPAGLLCYNRFICVSYGLFRASRFYGLGKYWLGNSIYALFTLYAWCISFVPGREPRLSCVRARVDGFLSPRTTWSRLGTSTLWTAYSTSRICELTFKVMYRMIIQEIEILLARKTHLVGVSKRVSMRSGAILECW